MFTREMSKLWRKIRRIRVQEFSLNKFYLPVSQTESSLKVTNFWADLPGHRKWISFDWKCTQVGPLQFHGRLDNGTKSNATKSNAFIMTLDLNSWFLFQKWLIILVTAFQALKIELFQYSKPLSFLQYSAIS